MRSRAAASSSPSVDSAGATDAGGRPVVAEHVAQCSGPLAGRGPRLGGLDGGGHDVRRLVGGDLGQLLEGAIDRVVVAPRLPALERLANLALDLGVRGEDAAVRAGRER